ncbi:hypothetical protein [Pararhizobium sp. IMCC21322]|uniref:hypothetical protein n=1 Tax=Pararhizobium sp. IMCC21322 TaxID=3067903 RepID=UPI0027404945|nr:hypothetical protein [Pararhizobium sp. IMCC21322]
MSEAVKLQKTDKRSFRWLRVLSRILIVVLVIALLPTVPVVYTMVLNEFRLWKFARQLHVFDELAENTNSRLIAEGRYISANIGSGEYCFYSGTRLYETFGGFNAEQLLNWKLVAQNHVFAAARKPDDGSNADVYLDIVDSLMLVRIDSGGFSVGLDFRCW